RAKLDELLRRQGPAREFYSIKEAAQVVGVSDDHIRRAVVGGVLPCSNVGSMDRPTYRISRADLLAWMEARKGGPLPPVRERGRSSGRPPRLRVAAGSSLSP